MQNKRVLILGATGQIGKELSLELKNFKDFNIISHCRTLVSASFFKHNGMEYIVGDLNDKNIISEIFNSDLIFDLAAPNSGSLKEIKTFYKDRLDLIFGNMKKNSKFIFASSMNAFGIDEKRKILKNYFFSSSIYASNKRYAEKYIRKLGKHNSISTYILRLGEVHGNYQRSSIEIIKLINEGYVFEIPNTPAWITFVSLIKDSIINILNDQEKPGLYTLVCDDIYWEDLLNLLSKKNKIVPKFIVKGKVKKFNIIYRSFYRFLMSKKDSIRGNFSINKNFEDLMKLNYRINKVKSSNDKFKGIKIYSDKNRYIGVLPGKRLKSLKYKINDVLN